MTVRAFLLAALLFAPGCGGSGPSDPPEPREMLVVAIARSDRSLPNSQTLEGYLAFFFDRDSEKLLAAQAVIDRFNPDGSMFSRALSDSFGPGFVTGSVYTEGINVDPGLSFQLHATVLRGGGGEATVTSTVVTVPSEFEVEFPDEVVAGQPLAVTWSVTGAEKVNVAVGAFSEHVAASLGAFTIPGAAFQGLSPGETVKVEITAYNTFYEPLGAAISTLSDAEAAAEKFRGIDNVTGGVGVLGAAFTLGHVVTVR